MNKKRVKSLVDEFTAHINKLGQLVDQKEERIKELEKEIKNINLVKTRLLSHAKKRS